MKKFIIFLMVLLFVVCFFGCEKTKRSTDDIQTQQTKQLSNEAQKQIGMPNIKNFTQKKTMKMIQELCDKPKLLTHTYVFSKFHGKFVYIGKSVGYGIPFSAQYTNPMRIYDAEKEGGIKQKFEDNGEVQVLPQPDPNQLYMPTSSSATWVILVNPNTKKLEVSFMEQEISVFVSKLPERLVLK